MTLEGTAPRALLAELDIDFEGPRVAAVGGGHGLAQVLQAALTYAGRIDAIVSVSDDGGSSGRLAPHLDIPPPGDIRKCLLALTPDESIWKQIFDYRFDEADVAGHSLGNLILAGLSDIEGSFDAALMRAEGLLKASGSVIPAAGEHLKLVAETEEGTLRGQVNISRYRGRIERIEVEPASAAANPRAIAALEAADQIVLGPGSLITSTVAAMRVPGITEAINRSKAHLVYIANLITQDGETIGMDAADHVDVLLRLTGVRPPGTIVCSESATDISLPLQSVSYDAGILATYGADLTAADLVDDSAEWPSHDPQKLGDVLKNIPR